jgi:hypothetical protein
MRPADARTSERGATAVVVIGVFVVLLLFLGMSVDFGILLRYRRAMQNACDAGVLAGGLNLRTDPATAAPTAIRYAENDMRQNNIAWDPARLTATVLPYEDQPNRQVQAEIHADVPMYFLRLVRDAVHVAVDCRARLANVILTQGLVPLGLNYEAWDDYANTQGCLPVIQGGVPLEERTPPCDSFEITISVSASDNPWGSGNSGMLAMQAPGETDECFDDCPVGARQWQDTFIEGSPQQYCFDQGQTAAVEDWTLDGDNCANVRTRPGTVTGPVINAVDERCDSGDPLDRIIVLVLLNPAYTDDGSGAYTTEIWGFAAFELDCDNRPSPGAGDVTISGGFVSFVSYRATGRETSFDTGVYTVKLVE